MPCMRFFSPLLGAPSHLPPQGGIWIEGEARVSSWHWGRHPVLRISAGLNAGLLVCSVPGGLDVQLVPPYSFGVFDDMCC